VPTTTTATAPPVADFEAIEDPIDRAAALSRLADDMGHRFPREHAAVRRAALRQARQRIDPDTARPYTYVKLGERVGVHSSRVWQIVSKRLGGALRAAPTAEGATS